MKAMSLLKLVLGQVWSLSTPKNISYLWGFGSLLGIVMVLQVISGLLLACFYISGSLAWESVVEITREVNKGWLLRIFHSNMASFVFMVLFIHMFRGMVQGSFSLYGPWFSGWLIMLLTMMAAFLGYVLPWGQMSFWGATVIINLLSVLPMGKTLVIWLWGGFYVSSYTCSFFYTFHFLVPMLVLLLSGVHLILLHFSGSSLPGGLSRSFSLNIKFTHLFLFKDIVNMIVLWGMWILALSFPDCFADPVNFIYYDLSNSPLHIQPEWYFLHLYAILRSIPNKLGGLIGFGLALILLLLLSFANFYQKMNQWYWYNYVVWLFIMVNTILMWLGTQPVEDPFVLMGQLMTIGYFSYIFMTLFMDKIVFNLYL